MGIVAFRTIAAMSTDTAHLLERNREAILRIAREHGAVTVRVFGSVARGDANSESDIDFLVELEDGRSLLDLSRLWQDLEDLLERRVDIVEPNGLHWYIRDRVLHEAVPL
jgi:predicted nucleotidyltransferase